MNHPTPSPVDLVRLLADMDVTAPSIATFEVECSVGDVCDDTPALEAVLLVTNHDVDEMGDCIEQIEEVNKRAKKLSEQDTVVIAVSKDSTEEIAAYEKSGKFEITLLSDPAFANARRFKSYDDFEEIELHSTILIDKQRRVHWASTGGAPFMNFDYLEREIKRLNSGVVQAISSGSVGGSR